VAAVVSILRSTRRWVACGICLVVSRNGTSAILGPIPIRSSRKVSMTKAAFSDSSPGHLYFDLCLVPDIPAIALVTFGLYG
jgi:hypothetical protein